MAASPTTMSHLDNVSSEPQKPLLLEIRAATKHLHTQTNLLVMSRLKMALAADAHQYIGGMLYFLPVYMTFEKLWLDFLFNFPLEGAASVVDGKPIVSERIHTILNLLHISQLFRSDHLRADIKSITGWSDEILNRRIHDITQAGELCDFISHIQETVQAKPHTLIAYSYNLFLALFKGGRIIRGYLEKAGYGFWENVPRQSDQAFEATTSDVADASPTEPIRHDVADAGSQNNALPWTMLRFWSFDTAEDGEDLKREYKETLLKWEGELSSDERDDILKESVTILESIISIVDQLDRIHSNEQKDSIFRGSENTFSNEQEDVTISQLDHTYSDEQEEKASLQILKRPSLASLFVQTNFVARIRDSFLIAKERGVGNSLRNRSLDKTSTEEGEHDSADQDADDGDIAAADVKLCHGNPKSMRFAKSLPVPPRRHGRVAAANGGDLDEKLGVTSPRQQADATMPRPILAGIIGLFLLYIFVYIRGMMSLG